MSAQEIPERIEAIKKRGFVVWTMAEGLTDLKARFPQGPIKVGGIRQVRVWGLQVDDERELHGHERTSIPDEELWQVQLVADDGSTFEVNATFVEAAPQDP